MILLYKLLEPVQGSRLNKKIVADIFHSCNELNAHGIKQQSSNVDVCFSDYYFAFFLNSKKTILPYVSHSVLVHTKVTHVTEIFINSVF